MQSLYKELQKAQTEEDVKDAYIKALGLKKYTKGLIDIQTEHIWFEAKHTGKNTTYAMFTQLLHYVQVALNKGEVIPPLLCVMDTTKAAIMKSADVIPFLAKKTIKWGKSASTKPTPEALAEISAYIGTYLVSFRIDTHEEEFVQAVKEAVKTGEILRAQINAANLKQVFDKWVAMIGSELEEVKPTDYALLFFADIMNDGTRSTHKDLPAELLFSSGMPVFKLGTKEYRMKSFEGYRQFWTIYHRPPKAEYRDYLLERRDSLIPVDERIFKGAFYTPLHVVDKAYELLAQTLGDSWQEGYVVWDMCCGVGNLEVKHSNPRNVYMSTLDRADIDVMTATRTCLGSIKFQYDYLNDDIATDGSIDYSLTGKVPESLRKIIREGKKKILVLINPPYGEAAKYEGSNGSEDKAGIARSGIGAHMEGSYDYGYASRELFAQFLARIRMELPNAVIATFSTLKYINSHNFAKFREDWRAKYQGGFIVHSKAFEGLTGDFPIGFLIWKSSPSLPAFNATSIAVEIIDKKANPVGEKTFYNVPTERFLSSWIVRPKPNAVDVVPLKNAVTPAVGAKDLRGTKWADNAIGSMLCRGNDLQNGGQGTALFSSGFASAGGFFVTTENLWKAAIVFAVRQVSKHTWVNHNDQFLQPNVELPEEFKNDCLIYMLFSGKNATASADDLEWNGGKWSIVNHFIPFTEQEVNADDRFESDFMVRYLKGRPLSHEAGAVMCEGKKLWRAYFEKRDTKKVRDELKLNRADVGWYQVRKALEARNEYSDGAYDFGSFKAAFDELSAKLRPLVYEYGFLFL
ncbi:hypothetical protein ACN4GS_09925 [Burkholderia pseudomallei]|uniref:hypothetical protein n=1 Tax=Burkholderia pseudomallei TaxID=28450 RepID=UPI003AF43EBC